MPYEIQKSSPRCWTVINKKTGSVKAKCTSKKNAEAQLKLLYGLERGWKPKKKKGGKGVEEIKSQLGDSLGKGFQGQVFDFGDGKVVKKLKRIKIGRDILQDIQNEYEVGKKAGEVGIGPVVYEMECDDTDCYIVMEKLTPTELTNENKDEVIDLFERAIRNKIVNVDGGYGRTNDGKLVMYDYGVSSIAPDMESAKTEYQDYLYFFKKFHNVDGVYSHFFPKEEKGGYLESFKRKAGLLPPPVRKMLETKGSVKISSIKIVRTPLSSFVSSLLNVISLGAYEKAVNESPYDSMFHLAMLINGRYTTEKNEVIKLYQGTPVKKNSETFDLPVSKNITIGELFENGRQKMGDDNFTNYDARSNNCQDFLLGLLDGSGLTTDDARKFIKQDAEVVFKKMPTVSEKIGRFLTDVGAVGERIMEGEGFKETWVIQGGRLMPVLIGGGPYKIYDSSPTCKSIINIDSGRVENHCLTESEAKKKQELLNRLYDEEKARIIVKKEVLDKKKKMPPKTSAKSWRDFYASQVKGKKFKNRAEVNSFMRECSKKWKEMKTKN